MPPDNVKECIDMPSTLPPPVQNQTTPVSIIPRPPGSVQTAVKLVVEGQKAIATGPKPPSVPPAHLRVPANPVLEKPTIPTLAPAAPPRSPIKGDFLESISKPAQPPVMTAPPPVPQAPTIPAALPKPTVSEQPQVTSSAEVAASIAMQNEILNEVRIMKDRVGISILESPEAGERGNVAHRAIWFCRHAPEKLIEKEAKELLAFEAAMTALQVWVQTIENEWAMRHMLLGYEISKIKMLKRGGVEADTVKEKEYLLIASDPGLAKMHYQFMLAQAMAKLFEGIGDRYAQFEDGLKRAIDYVVSQEERSRIQGRHQ